MPRAELAGHRLTVELDAEDGGKVTRLRCERHGREWLHGPTGAADRGDGFGAGQAWGWDELFPTVLPTTAAPDPWPPRLRDHGELWGRPWLAIDDATVRYDDPAGRFRFTRTLLVGHGMLRALYELHNGGREALPWMWAMHPIFAIEPGDRLELPGIDTVTATHVRPTAIAPTGPVGWPGPGLDRLEPADDLTALKLYAGPRRRHIARITGRTCSLEIAAALPYLGIYVNRGGWPEPGSGLHQLGLEPTTAPVDDLATAAARGLARTCRPGETSRWAVEVRIA